MNRKRHNLDIITNISSFEMKIKIKTHEIRDEKKKHVAMKDAFSKDSKPQSFPSLPAPPHEDGEIRSPALSGRNISEERVSETTKDVSENENGDKNFRLSIEPHLEKNKEKIKDPEKSKESEKTEDKDNKKPKVAACDCGHAKKVDFHDDVAHHVKFESFDIIRLIGKGSFGQVFMVFHLFNSLHFICIN